MVPVRKVLNKPHYVFRPTQLLRRIAAFARRREETKVSLPWGTPIRVRTDEMIGASIARTGVYDLCVSEALARLVDPGDLVLDAGANIGYMTGLCAIRAGSTGRVVAFEPHPDVFRELVYNVALLKRRPGSAEVSTLEIALSDSGGRRCLQTGAEFDQNRGTASFSAAASTVRSTVVDAKPLDDLFDQDAPIGLLKVDVEGHELKVLRGAHGLLGRGQIRDILFEEHRDPPTPVTQYLSSQGYSVLAITQHFLGPKARPIDSGGSQALWDPPSYLATLEEERALRRLAPRGWRVLR